MAKWDLKMTPEEFYRQGPDPFNIQDDPVEVEKRKDVQMLLSREDNPFVPGIEPYKRGIDLACGEGWFTKVYAEYCEEMYACDISETAIKRAEEECPGVKYFAHDITKPFGRAMDRNFDLVVLGEAIYYINPKDIRNLANSIYSILKDDGDFYIIVSQCYHQFDIAGMFFDEIDFHTTFISRPFSDSDDEYIIMKGRKKL